MFSDKRYNIVSLCPLLEAIENKFILYIPTYTYSYGCACMKTCWGVACLLIWAGFGIKFEFIMCSHVSLWFAMIRVIEMQHALNLSSKITLLNQLIANYVMEQQAIDLIVVGVFLSNWIKIENLFKCIFVGTRYVLTVDFYFSVSHDFVFFFVSIFWIYIKSKLPLVLANPNLVL